MSKHPSLLPREHGAYAELAFPLLTGLCLAPPSPAGLALAGAALVFFLVHEPLAVLMGIRGQRLKSQLQNRARTRAASLLVTGLVLAEVSWWGAGGRIWPSLLFPALPAVLLIPLVLSGRQKTLAGELLVITVFSTLVLPLAAASGADPARAAWAALVWWVSFFLGTLEVHAIKARHKHTPRSRWTRWGSPVASAAVAAVALVGGGSMGEVDRWPVFALLPPAVGVLALGFVRVHPRHLKRVGWTLVGANALVLFFLLWRPGW
jgi:hypothetical protein